MLNLSTSLLRTLMFIIIIEEHYENETRRLNASNIVNGFPTRNWFEEADSKFYDFKKDARKEVSYLVKEFECRKSASAYARALLLVPVFLIHQNFTHTSSMKISLRKLQFFQMVRIMD